MHPHESQRNSTSNFRKIVTRISLTSPLGVPTIRVNLLDFVGQGPVGGAAYGRTHRDALRSPARTVLKGVAGVAGLATVPAIIAACSSPACLDRAERRGPERRRTERRRTERSGPERRHRLRHVGSYHTDPRHRRTAWRPSTRRSPTATGIDVKMNTVDHSTFQDQISQLPRRHAGRRLHVVLRLPHEVLRRAGPAPPDRRRLGEGQGQLHRRLRPLGRRQRRQGVRHPGRLLPVGRLLSQEPLHRQGLHGPDDLGRVQDPVPRRCRPTA